MELKSANIAVTANDYLHVSGNQILDYKGNQVYLTGIAWFGFETPNEGYHGLWTNSMENILNMAADNGFNLLRVPLSVQLVNQWRKGIYPTTNQGIIDRMSNPKLADLNTLELLDASIAYCKNIGLKVMLDMHRVNNGGQSPVWYDGPYTAEDYEESWKWLADHFKNDDTVIAMDIFNEPHGDIVTGAKWDGSTDKNNWKYEAEKVGKMILAINPNLLIVIEGNEKYESYGSWWGGNLRGVAKYPADLGGGQGQIVYSPHEYGPSVSPQTWFYPGFNEETLYNDVWYPNWFYLFQNNTAPLLIGEWGGRIDGGDNEKWMRALASLISKNKLNHTFWCINPNSGDTGGILEGDWKTVDSIKYELVKPTLWKDASGKFIGLSHRVVLGKNGTNVSQYYGDTSTNAKIEPTKATFDKNISNQTNISVLMTLTEETLIEIQDDVNTLRLGVDYIVSESSVIIQKSYLATLPLGDASLVFNFSLGDSLVLTISVMDSSVPTHTLKLQMFNTSTNASSNSIGPKFRLINEGDTAAKLADIQIRYYYTIDGEKAQNCWCDWASAGSSNITSKFVKMPSATANADYYLEIGFINNAGSIAPGQSTEVQVRIAKSDWTNYMQTDDYSFNLTASNYVDWSKACVYVNGKLNWGIEPI